VTTFYWISKCFGAIKMPKSREIKRVGIYLVFWNNQEGEFIPRNREFIFFGQLFDHSHEHYWRWGTSLVAAWQGHMVL
jgi:hypothetical protein